MTAQLKTASRGTPSILGFSAVTAVAAVMAAVAAAASLALALPVWAMFTGWVAFFTRGVNARDGVVNSACVLFGMFFGMGAALAIGGLNPLLGVITLPVVVFGIAMVVVSLRAVPVANNNLCYFLGLIAYFASHQPPSLMAVAELGSAAVLGSVAAWIAHSLQRQLNRAA
jgi:hypothetical protein